MTNPQTSELPRIEPQIVAGEDHTDPSNVDFLDVAIVLAKERRLIFTVTLAMLVVATLISFAMRPSFTATAVILPPQPQQQSIVSAAEGQMSSLAALSGSGSIFKNPADLYVGILEGRTIADQLINKFKLQSIYKTTLLEDARARLKSNSSIQAAKDGLIEISVTDHNPRLASDLANGYVDELHNLNSTLAISQAAQRRVFFDQELTSEKNALANAEDDLKNTQQKTGLIQLTGQAAEIIQNIAQVRAEISSREVQIQSLRTFATDQNPETIRVQEEIDTLRGQLAKLENSQSALLPGDINVPAGQVPEATLEYERKVREVHYHEALYSLLSNQYEAARIDEAKSAPLIQVVDRAVPPQKKSSPHRLLIVLSAAAAGFIGSCIWVLVRNGYRRIGKIPENAVRIQELGQQLRRRS